MAVIGTTVYGRMRVSGSIGGQIVTKSEPGNYGNGSEHHYIPADTGAPQYLKKNYCQSTSCLAACPAAQYCLVCKSPTCKNCQHLIVCPWERADGPSNGGRKPIESQTIKT